MVVVRVSRVFASAVTRASVTVAQYRRGPFTSSFRMATNSIGRAYLGTRQAPKVFPLDGFEIIDNSVEVEEETLPFYRDDVFYPVRLGEVMRDQYQILAKLGYGASSTTWLSRDLLRQRFFVLKVHVNRIPYDRELNVLQHLQSIESDHPGRQEIRMIDDHFSIQGPHGKHIVHVLPPMGVSVELLQDLQRGGVYKEDTARSAVQQALIALNFLHCEAFVVHTDVHAGNLLVGITDESLLAEFEEKELAHPSPRKLSEDRVLHTSQMLLAAPGHPQLCDFGHARICPDNQQQHGSVMPKQYKAPEILLDMPWDYAIDVWSVGLMAWDLLHADSLFKIYNYDDADRNEALHLAHMVSLLGPPPVEFLQRGSKSLKYWDEDGNWRGPIPIPPPVSLESLATSLDGQSKEEFLSFIRALLKWQPEERLASGDAFHHPWVFKPQTSS